MRAPKGHLHHRGQWNEVVLGSGQGTFVREEGIQKVMGRLFIYHQFVSFFIHCLAPKIS